MLDRIECSYNYGDLSSSDNMMLDHLFAEAMVTMPKSAVTTVKLSSQLINCYENRRLYLLANTKGTSIKKK